MDHDADDAELDRLTRELLDVLRGSMSATKFKTWVCTLRVDSCNAERIVISFDNRFQVEWNQKRYGDLIRHAVDEVVGPDVEIVYRVRDQGRPSDAPAPARATSGGSARGDALKDTAAGDVEPPTPDKAPTGFRLNDQYTLDNFVVGPSNQFAYAAARAVAETPGGSYNPLFIHGQTGMGKTHLLQGICHQALASGDARKVLFLSSETFVNEFIGAIERGDLDRFRYRYRSVDLLLIDDIHLLAHKERTQDEFFHTFNTLYNEGKQIVLSSDSSPSDIPTIRERLSSRFKWGLVTEIQRPRYETRLAILQRKAFERHLEIGEDVLAYLARSIERNIRELEGAINKVAGYAQLSDRPIDLELAQLALQDTDVRGSMMSQPARAESILEVVGRHFNVTTAEIIGRRRTASIVTPRQLVMFLMRKLTSMSYEEIGRHVGGRDHSTVLYAVRKIEKKLEKDRALAQLLAELEREIMG